ncbi:MAG: hypothetical protein ACRC45_06430, partial [Cetobacterium sp.]
MNDKLKVARCNESEISAYMSTLNDYTLAVTKDTHKLYTRIDGNPVLITGGDTPHIIDEPLTKSLSVWAINKDVKNVHIGSMYGIVANSDGTYRLTAAKKYDGELIGVVESKRYNSNTNEDQYQVSLLSNLVVFKGDSEKELKQWDPVYIGRDIVGNIISVCDKGLLEEVYGIAGVVSEISENKGYGLYFYNAFILQTSFFVAHDTGELLHKVVEEYLKDYVTNKNLSDVLSNYTLAEEFNNLKKTFEDNIKELKTVIANHEDRIKSLEGGGASLPKLIYDFSNVGSNVYAHCSDSKVFETATITLTLDDHYTIEDLSKCYVVNGLENVSFKKDGDTYSATVESMVRKLYIYAECVPKKIAYTINSKKSEVVVTPKEPRYGETVLVTAKAKENYMIKNDATINNIIDDEGTRAITPIDGSMANREASIEFIANSDFTVNINPYRSEPVNLLFDVDQSKIEIVSITPERPHQFDKVNVVLKGKYYNVFNRYTLPIIQDFTDEAETVGTETFLMNRGGLSVEL